MIHQPYIGYIRDTADNLYRVAWAPADERATVFPHPTAFRSNRYYPDDIDPDTIVGAVPTDLLEWSPYRQTATPGRVCRNCFIGDVSWWTDATFPTDAPPVELGVDGFALHCKESEMGVQSVGLAAPRPFRVSGSPVTSRGILSLDWELGISLGQVPTVQADGSVLFQDPSPQIFTARLVSQPTPATLLQATMSVIYGADSNEVELFNPSDIDQVGLGDLVEFGSGRTPSTIVRFITSPYIGFNTSNNSVLANSMDTATVTPYGYDWFETVGSVINSALYRKPGGRSGSITTAPAIQMGYQASRGTQDSDVWMRFRGVSSGLPVFDFEGMGIPFSAVYNYGSPAQPSTTTINYLGNTTYPTTINYNSSVVLNFWNGSALIPLFVGPAINPAAIPLSCPGWRVATINYNDFSGSAPATINVFTMAAKEVILAVLVDRVVSWAGSFGPPSSITFGYTGGAVVPTAAPSDYGTHSVLTARAAFEFSYVGADNQAKGAAWTFTASQNGSNPSTMTAGQMRVLVLTSIAP